MNQFARKSKIRQQFSKRKLLPVLALVVSVGLLAGCTAPTASPEPSTGASSDANEFAALLPEPVRASGKLVVGTTPTYNPYEFMADDGKTIIGANVEVVEQLAKLFGLELVWESTAEYGSLIPATQSGKYDFTIIFEDTVERQKVVDIVDFYEDGQVFLGKAGGTSDPTVVCGTTVAVGTGNGADLKSGSINEQVCKSQGKPDITFQNFANTDAQLVALSSGRVDFMLTSGSVVAVFVKSNPGFSARTPVYGVAPVGIAAPKGNGMAEALEAGLQKLADDGVIREIFKKWGLEGQPVDKVVINAKK